MLKLSILLTQLHRMHAGTPFKPVQESMPDARMQPRQLQSVDVEINGQPSRTLLQSLLNIDSTNCVVPGSGSDCSGYTGTCSDAGKTPYPSCCDSLTSTNFDTPGYNCGLLSNAGGVSCGSGLYAGCCCA